MSQWSILESGEPIQNLHSSSYMKVSHSVADERRPNSSVLPCGVIVSIAALQAERTISPSVGIARKPKCTITYRRIATACQTVSCSGRKTGILAHKLSQSGK